LVKQKKLKLRLYDKLSGKTDTYTFKFKEKRDDWVYEFFEFDII